MLKGRNGTSLSGDAAAYWEPLDKVMMTLMRGAEFHNELDMLFGPGSGTTITADIGVVATTPQVGGPVNWNAAPLIQLTRQSWAAGIWNQAGDGGNTAGGMLIDVYNSAGDTLVASNIPVQGVGDPSLCQVKLKAGGTGASNPAAGQRIVAAGALGKACVGVQGILQNTGTFANINAANQIIWRARQFSSGNAKLTRAKILGGVAKLFPNGAKNGLVAFANANTFADLAEETNDPTKSGGQWWENGAETRIQGATKLVYLSPVGKVEIRLHEYMKQGLMPCLEAENTVRVGASDITFRGADGNEGFFLELPNNAGSEIRCLSQQAPLIKLPWRSCIFTGIVNDNDDTSGS
jgi:hypothetical protein